MAVSLTESTKQHDGKIIVIKGRQKCDIFGRWQFSIVELYGQQKILQADAKILKKPVLNVVRIKSAEVKGTEQWEHSWQLSSTQRRFAAVRISHWKTLWNDGWRPKHNQFILMKIRKILNRDVIRIFSKPTTHRPSFIPLTSVNYLHTSMIKQEKSLIFKNFENFWLQ